MRWRITATRSTARTTVLAVMATFALAGSLGNSCETATTAPAERQVMIGGLFSLTGGWTRLGLAGRAAMELAIEDVNKYLAGNAANVRFVAAIEDTKLDPAIALEKARLLRSRGVQLLIGAQSSAEVERLKPFVDSAGMLLVSPSSTAGSLAIAGDNVFRFTPGDSLESVALSALMWDEGIRALIPVWRDDAGNAGLERAIRAHFTTRGGTVLEGVKYATTVTDFGPTIGQVNTQVQQAGTRFGNAKVGVLLTGFDEVSGALASAAAHPALGAVRWYGTDGSARSDAIIANPAAAAFAARVGYPNAIFGLEEGARDMWAPIVERISARSGEEAGGFVLAVYDAVWVVARGYIASGATTDARRLEKAFTTAAATGYGATGWMALDSSGDRKYGDFDFWAVRDTNGAMRWTRVARYETRTRRVVR